MTKISITIKSNCISFNSFNKNVSDENLNNTNIINTKSIKFTEEYIINNLDLVSAFLNLIIVICPPFNYYVIFFVFLPYYILRKIMVIYINSFLLL